MEDRDHPRQLRHHVAGFEARSLLRPKPKRRVASDSPHDVLCEEAGLRDCHRFSVLGPTRSAFEAHRCEGKNAGEGVVVTVEVEDRRLVLLRAGCDQ
jgi:hypothetical protein